MLNVCLIYIFCVLCTLFSHWTISLATRVNIHHFGGKSLIWKEHLTACTTQILHTTRSRSPHNAPHSPSIIYTGRYRHTYLWYIRILYSGKLLREKTFANFTDLWLFTQVFSAKFGGVAPFGVAQASYPQKFSLWNCIFQQFAFSPSKVSHYTVCILLYLCVMQYFHKGCWKTRNGTWSHNLSSIPGPSLLWPRVLTITPWY